MAWPKAGGGGSGTVKTINGVSPNGAGDVDLSGKFVALFGGSPIPFNTGTIVGGTLAFTPDISTATGKWLHIVNVQASGGSIVMPVPPAGAGLKRSFYVRTTNDNVGGHGDLTIAGVTFVGVRHAMTQVAQASDDWYFETEDAGATWLGWHLTAELVAVGLVAPTLPVVGQLFANTA